MRNNFDPSKIKGIKLNNSDEKAVGRGRRIGNRLERFDPNAIDGDNDGTVQEGTAFERPAGPKNMPKIKPVEVPQPEKVPLPQPQREPSTPTRVPDKPVEVPQRAIRARKITGSIGNERDNSISPDDDEFGADIFDPNDLAELNQLQGNVLDEINESMLEGTDWEAELEKITGPDKDVSSEDLREAQRVIDAVNGFLAEHPFNPENRDYEQREWADDEYDSQAQRYAPRPMEISNGGEIDWDSLIRTAGLTSSQKDDWELTPDELEDRQALKDLKLDKKNPASKAERAAIWARVQNGEGYREIAPDYPEYHWSLVRDMARQGAKEAGINKQQVNAAERAAKIKAAERAQEAGQRRLMDSMIDARTQSDLANKLNDALEQVKNSRKRVSNEYQMLRKKTVELWRLASLLYESAPKQKDGESTPEYAQRMYDWFFATGGNFAQIARELNNIHDITTATDRSYDFLTNQYDEIRNKLNDVKSFWTELQNYKNLKNPPGGGQIAGSIRSGATPRGIRIASSAKAKPVNFREFDEIQSDINKLMRGSFSNAPSAKRPQGLSKNENAIISSVRSSTRFPRGFWNPRKKPKKA